MPAINARHILSAAACLFAVGAASSASAETLEREILGWTSTGQEVVVKLTERGERMVDGMSKDYYFEATEIWSATDAELVQRYKRGEAVGSPPNTYTEAKDEKFATSYIENVGLLEASPHATSPDGKFRLTEFGTTRIESPKKGAFECELRTRVMLLSTAKNRGYTVLEHRTRGERATRRDEARCPRLEFSPTWGPASDRWAALLTGGEEPKLIVGQTEPASEFDALAHADFLPRRPLIAERTEGPEREAWIAISDGRLEEAAEKFSEADLHTALAEAWTEKRSKRATRAADAAWKQSNKTTKSKLLRAAAWVLAGSGKRAAGWIDEAVKSAQGYDDLLGYAALFELIDVKIANQLAVHALSHPTAKEADTERGWALLARGLIDVGDYSNADEALGHVEEPGPETLIERARLHLDRRDDRRAALVVDDLLFANPGRCEAYLLAGRLHSLRGDNAAARQMFDSAIFCDDTLAEALFYSADFARLGGDVARSAELFSRYLEVAPLRRSDEIRNLRRAAAQSWVKRLTHDGVVLTDTSCRRLGERFLCSGTLHNTTSEAIGPVKIEVGLQRKSLGTAEVESIEPGASAPFGVNFASKNLDDIIVTAGRNRSERKLNATPAR